MTTKSRFGRVSNSRTAASEATKRGATLDDLFGGGSDCGSDDDCECSYVYYLFKYFLWGVRAEK